LPDPLGGGGGEVWIIGVRISGLNGLGCGNGARIGEVDPGLPLGLGSGEIGLPIGLASGVAQYPQNTVPSGLSLPHCLHAGIRSPWPHHRIFAERIK
jgi:hypothetical protein